MQTSLTIQPISYVIGNVQLPGSKSISNRILLLAAMSKGITNIYNLLCSDDTRHMLNALKTIGITIKKFNNDNHCTIYGNTNAFYHNYNKKIFLGNSGTSMRSLVAVFSLGNNKIELTGDKRMQERPINDLVNALRQGGAIINYINDTKFPPISLEGGFIGGNICINGNISSQFLTALLIACPLASKDTYISVKDQLVSKPYIDITLQLIKKFGVHIIHNNYKTFLIKGNQQYVSPQSLYIEGDMSSGSYFLAAAAIKGKKVKINGVGVNSIQGDIQFTKILKKMGAIINIKENYITCQKNYLQSVNLDMNHIPDAAMTIAIVALFAQGTTVIRNIYNWRVKETDRILAMSTELRKIGAIVKEGKNYISVTPPNCFQYAVINTYNDHRIAMCFALIALSEVAVTILNPECTFKTYPNFFKHLLSISVFK
ncbi:3-phosphoshikimate 1-carboxyvinyltransferase [Buchnera aphidicola (Nipponaphis monzeni)]|uniref:3-phosphoshikimate 1-carboxyvinyltransferase n=1 Tax=Buchnera aphidicola (Nipponaphis monzeni) TaxID=2495405 RepID=A0A455TA87_9GAMM|nr:3-phosphoshikimate 1-carboxyvinyltransferase [Buchnera aphidicola]BBI01254.1 3-phosphoshikimate 1-carboxyvinyltransferase [Buchnera aphidicola (Nipponaphis monzeni)]